MDIFETHPNLKQCWKTSDDQFFYTENAAKNHASKLKDKTVEHMERSSFEVNNINPDSNEKSAELKLVKGLNKEPLKEYASSNFPDMEILEEDNKETVLNKVLAAIEAKYTTTEE